MDLFELEPIRHRLRFDEATRYPGLEVVLNSDVEMSVLFDMSSFEEVDTEGKRGLLHRFGEEILLEWNYAKRGVAVPATGAGFLRCPPHLTAFLIGKWLEVATEVEPPLVEPSTSGTFSPELTTISPVEKSPSRVS